MKKNKLNLLLDAVLLLLTAGLAGGGFLVYYVLVPGREAKAIYGHYAELKFWGLSRFEWADIHLILCFIFLAVLFLHIVLHWKMLINMMKTCFRRTRYHRPIIFLLIFFTLGIMILPFFIQPEIQGRMPESSLHLLDEQIRIAPEQPVQKQNHYPGQQIKKSQSSTLSAVEGHEQEVDIDVNGRQTLREACIQHGISPKDLCSALHIPDDAKNERLGRIKRKHNLAMSHIKEVILQLKLTNE